MSLKLTCSEKIYEIGRKLYDMDVRECPNYHDGKPRPTFEELPDHCKKTWIPQINPF